MKRGRRPASARAPYKKLSSEEIRLARMWYTEDGMSADEIAGLLRRDRSTMTRLLVMEQAPQAIRTSSAFACRIRVSVLSVCVLACLSCPVLPVCLCVCARSPHACRHANAPGVQCRANYSNPCSDSAKSLSAPIARDSHLHVFAGASVRVACARVGRWGGGGGGASVVPSQCPHSAPTVPSQCPQQCPHGLGYLKLQILCFE